MADKTNWSKVTDFFNGVLEEAADYADDPAVGGVHLELKIYSPAMDETLSVVVPERSVEDFMKRVAFFEAVVTDGRF